MCCVSSRQAEVSGLTLEGRFFLAVFSYPVYWGSSFKKMICFFQNKFMHFVQPQVILFYSFPLFNVSINKGRVQFHQISNSYS